MALQHWHKMAYNGVMNMRNLILFLFLAVTANAQTIKDGSIVPRMNNIANYSPSDIKNLQIYTSVASNALTIGIYGTDTGAAPTTLKPLEIIFRNSSNGIGNYVKRQVTAATTLVVPSGTTLGTTNGVEAALWVYAIDNDGTVELGVSNFSIVDTSLPVSSTAISGGATRGVLYSTTARTSKPARLIAKILSTQTTAGTWATNPSTYQIGNFSTYVSPTITRYTSGTSATYTVPKNVKYLVIHACGAGGGGGGSGTSGGGNGGAGGSTSITGVLTAGGGSGGLFDNAGGDGGTVSVDSSVTATIIDNRGGRGGAAGYGGTGFWIGGAGGVSILGGAGAGGITTGEVAKSNSCSGGGGGGTNNTASSKTGGGGGAGGYIVVLINNPNSSYTYSVGAAGTAGTAGSSGSAGGAGGAGFIWIYEYYQ